MSFRYSLLMFFAWTICLQYLKGICGIYRQFLVDDCEVPFLGVLRNVQSFKIFQPPDQTRHFHNDMLLMHSRRSIFGNQIPMQFLEVRLAFAGEDGCR